MKVQFHKNANFIQSADRGRCAMLRFSPLQSAQFQDS